MVLDFISGILAGVGTTILLAVCWCILFAVKKSHDDVGLSFISLPIYVYYIALAVGGIFVFFVTPILEAKNIAQVLGYASFWVLILYQNYKENKNVQSDE